MARPQVIAGELLPIKGGLRLVNTPLVKMIFDPGPDRRWPSRQYTTNAAYRSTVDYLREIAKPEISHFEIAAIAVLIHERFVYAKDWRRSRGLINASEVSPVKELKKLRRIAVKGSWDKVFVAFRGSSLFVRDLLTEVTGDFIYPYSAVDTCEALVKAAETALNDPRLKVRPREFEIDRCASLVIASYERFTGRAARLANDPMSGKPVSDLHQFARTLGGLYELDIVTSSSDDRLAKMLKNRTEFGHGEMLLVS